MLLEKKRSVLENTGGCSWRLHSHHDKTWRRDRDDKKRWRRGWMERLLSFPFRSPRRRLITRIERESCSQRTARPVVPVENVVRCWVMVYDCLLHDIWGGSFAGSCRTSSLPCLLHGPWWRGCRRDETRESIFASKSSLLPDLIFHFSRPCPLFDWRSRSHSQEGRLHGGQTKASGRETLPFRELTMYGEGEMKKRRRKENLKKSTEGRHDIMIF